MHNYRFILRHSLASVAVVVLMAHVIAAEDVLERFRTEYPKAALRFQEHYANGLTVTSNVMIPESKLPLAKSVFFFGSKIRVESNRERNRLISCVGDRWTFSGIQNGENFELIYMNLNDPQNTDDIELNLVRQLFRPEYYVFGFPLIDVMQSRDFRVLKCAEVVSKSDKLMKVDFQWMRGPRLSKEAVLLDPERGWAIRKHEMSSASGEPIVTDVLYAAVGNLPTDVTVTIGGKPFRKATDLHWVEGALPAEPFRPSFYGLPEYSDLKKIWTYVLGAALCLATGSIFLWLRSKKS